MNEVEVNQFSLRDTIECGQTFCWIPEGNGYINADIGQAVYVEQIGKKLRWESSDRTAPIADLFRLGDPLKDIHLEIDRDSFMRSCIDYAPGLRIIRDPAYPCLVSFLCATWKNIPAIKTMVQRIRETCGPQYEFRDKTYYGMPTPEQLCEIELIHLKSLGLAWRAEFIAKSTNDIVNGEIDLNGLQRVPYEEAHSELMRLHGVGNKVADCVSLFALGHLEAFPIDVWIERIIQKHYNIFKSAGNSYKRKSAAAREYFGRYAGYAQEYLYYFSRNAQNVKKLA
ncbi:MAG: DNA-3-methyladenine glycosylase family protein [Candidatus Thorarchaeota archaeon]